MKKLQYLLFTTLFFITFSQDSTAQTFFTESFEGLLVANGLPSPWEESTAGATDGIYDVGDNLMANTGGFWPVPVHTKFAQTNDDVCNCDKSNDKLIMPMQDFTAIVGGVNLYADLYMDGLYGSSGLVEVSTDNKLTWTTIYTIPALSGTWQDSTLISLNAYVGMDSIFVAFRYEDNAQWATGLGVDNVSLAVVPAFDDLSVTGTDGEYTSIPLSQAAAMNLNATVTNGGTADATDAILTANVYLGAALQQSTTSSATAITAGQSATLSASTYTPTATGLYTFEYVVSSALLADNNSTNDTMLYQFVVDDNYYARDVGNVAVTLGLNAPSYGELGNVFDITNPSTQMDSVMFYFSSTSVGDTTSVKIYAMSAGLPTTQIGMSGNIIVTPADTGGVVMLVPVTNMTGGVLTIPTGQVYVAITDSETGFLGLGFSSAIYTTGRTLANINGGAFTDVGLFGFPNPAIVRPYLSITCPALSNTMTPTTSSCVASTGTATAAPSGGATPYTFMWSANATSQTTAMATGLAAGVYYLTYTDFNGCSDMDTVTITNPNAPTVSIVVANSLDCYASANGVLNAIDSGGTGAITFQWGANANSQTAQSASGLMGGTYSVTATDAANCSVVESYTLVAPDSISVIPNSIGNVSCFGGSDGMIMITTIGGTSPYTYAWSNNATTEDITGLSAASYSGTVTDANGCTFSASLTINEPAQLMASAVDNGNGISANANASGGTPPYSFLWDTNANNQTAQTAVNLTPGTYSVTVTDDNGCTSDTTVTILGLNFDNIEGLTSLNMFPNPTNANVFVELDLKENKDVAIRVINVTGQTVLENNLVAIKSQTIEIKTADLPTGIYMVQFTIGDETTSRKLIIDRK